MFLKISRCLEHFLIVKGYYKLNTWVIFKWVMGIKKSQKNDGSSTGGLCERLEQHWVTLGK